MSQGEAVRLSPPVFSKRAPEMLYIHWPFCKNKCHYCDFVAFEGHNGFEPSYHRALCNEIASYNGAKGPIDTIFIGGGTPSLYPLSLMPELFATVTEHFDCSQTREITLEVNPGGQSEQQYRVWRDLGVNRVSVGVQVLDEKLLASLNRYQTNAAVEQFMMTAPDYFPQVSADLIIGLPGVSDRCWEKTIDRVLSWPINHVSVYFLTVHEQTVLYYGLQKKRWQLPQEEKLILLYKKTLDRLSQAGFYQYEISNFARPGGQSEHNKGYWNRRPYKGFGIGAASFDGSYRFSNAKNLGKYIDHFEKAPTHELVVQFAEKLTHEQKFHEAVMLGLRQMTGLDSAAIIREFAVNNGVGFRQCLAQLRDAGYITLENGVACLLPRGIVCENEVAVRLVTAATQEVR